MKFKKHHIKIAKKWTGIDVPKWMQKPLVEVSQFILRVGVSLMIMTHGFGKISNFSSLVDTFPDPLSIGSKLSLISAIGAEFFAGIFLALGLFTRFSALALLFAMYVIVFIFHLNDPFKVKELAVLYGLVFLTFVLTGGNKWSMDHLIRSKVK